MNIQWNKVTWYSKLAALILFVLIVPAITFCIGREYERMITIQSDLETGVYNKAVFIPISHVDPIITDACEPHLVVTSLKPNQEISFPVTVTGRVDNTNVSVKCNWKMFEGQAGSAQVFLKNNGIWIKSGDSSVVKVAEWTEATTTFSVTLNTAKGQKPESGTSAKIVFTDEDASGMGNTNLFEIPVMLK